MLLKGNLKEILMNFDMNFTNKEEDILKNVVIDERMINHSNFTFKTSDPIIRKFDFLKGFSTLYDLLIGLSSEKITINEVN